MIDLTHMFDMDEVCLLVPFPCGCVVEANVKCCKIDDTKIFECPWCQAAFNDAELSEWINGDAPPPIYLEAGPRTILRWQKRLLEVEMERHGMPVVRMGQQLVALPDADVEWVGN